MLRRGGGTSENAFSEIVASFSEDPNLFGLVARNSFVDAKSSERLFTVELWDGDVVAGVAFGKSESREPCLGCRDHLRCASGAEFPLDDVASAFVDLEQTAGGP